MNLVLFGHPADFLGSQSMPRMIRMIAEGMRQRGHAVQIWQARPVLGRLPCPRRWKKWLGYFDQFILFSLWTWWRVKRQPAGTVFVFTDQALGPWVYLLRHKPNVVHLNDFLAIRSALGEFPQNPTGASGRIYQKMISRGLRHGARFICISERTQRDLLRLIEVVPDRSQVVYLGLNHPYVRMDRAAATRALPCDAMAARPEAGFLLHVGGNQWYKNRGGVLALYAAYVRRFQNPPQLWMVGAPPTAELKKLAHDIPMPGTVHFFSGWSNDALCASYSLAKLLIFPSLAEGFGWPIVEAMACGCQVLTTEDAPMIEVGGDAAHYLAPMPSSLDGRAAWADEGAARIEEIIHAPAAETAVRVKKVLSHATRYEAGSAMRRYEEIYQAALADRRSQQGA